MAISNAQAIEAYSREYDRNKVSLVVMAFVQVSMCLMCLFRKRDIPCNVVISSAWLSANAFHW